MLKKSVKTGLFFGGVGILGIIGVSLIVHSCSSDTPVQPQAQLTPQAQQQYNQLPPQQQAPPLVVYQQAPQEDHFWRDMYLYHAFFGGNDRTVIVHQPVPVYHPAYNPPVRQDVQVNKTVQNITINQTVNNHVSGAAPVSAPAQPVAQPPKAVRTPAPAATLTKGGWWATPTQVVKASTNYPKASNSNTGGYAVKSTGYSGYSMKSSGYSARSSGRR